jgi:hypothetical protein
MRAGRRVRLRVSLSAPGRLKVVVTRMSRPRRGRVGTLRVPAKGRRLGVRMPGSRRLAPGRYRVSIVAIDAQGGRSTTVKRRLVVLPAR